MDPGPASPTFPDQRPRTRSRGISFRSDKSAGSDGRTKLTDSPRDKAQRDILWAGQTKSNPNAAMNEVQPGARNVLEQSTLQNLREGQYKDANGNWINDPDRSNPTRPRLERPLDTIRSFERAIDDGYKRRNSYMKQDSVDQYDKENQYASRRSSFFGGSDHNSQGPHRPLPNGGYYGSQSYYGPPRTRYANNRMQSESQLYGNHRPYPQHGYHQSHDTVNTGVTNGSDSTGPWGNSTDPSSENSSIDKVNAMNKPPTPSNGYHEYGSNGYNGPIMEEQQGGHNGYGEYWQENGHGRNGGMRDDYGQGPSNAQHNGYGPRDMHSRSQSTQHLQEPKQARRPIQLGGSSAGDGNVRQTAPPPPAHSSPPEKKGWLKRRFSKKT